MLVSAYLDQNAENFNVNEMKILVTVEEEDVHHGSRNLE